MTLYMDIPKKQTDVRQMNLAGFIIPNRPSEPPTEVDNPKKAKGELKIGEVALKMPRKPRFNEMFVLRK